MAKQDVVVIGAGMAALAAARVVAEAGLRVVVLEARQEVGGRIRTVRDRDTVIELGAEFVHGRAPELWALIEEAGLRTYERTGDFLRHGDAGLEPMDEQDDDDDPLEKLKEFAGPDCSFVEYLERVDFPEEERGRELGFVEGFNAADANEASAMALGRQQAAEDAIDGERSWRIGNGYQRLPEYVAGKVRTAGGEVVFGAEVVRLVWSRGAVEVECGDGRVWAAKAVVVALPLGILQSGRVRFEPDVPGILGEASKLRMGGVCRFTCVFSERLWPEEMSFLLTPELLPMVWWTARPEESRSLTGWVGGPRSAKLLALSEDELKQRAVAAIAEALEIGKEKVRGALTAFYTHNWSADEWTRGAYSWVAVGAVEASAAMCEPVAETLFFAGEHTDTTGHWGTVHAALRSGLRAGGQVVARMLGQ